ncbi:MAG: ATP-binding protein [Pseudomonadota bacterium]
MKIKLSHKIFAAFLLMAVASVGLMVVLTRHFAGRNFEDYIFKRDISILRNFSLKLSDYYRLRGNWTQFAENTIKFNEFFMESQFGFIPLWKDGPPFAERSQPFQLPPADKSEARGSEPRPSGGPGEPGLGPPPPPWPHGPEPPPKPKFPDIDRRITLFDDQKNFVAGGGKKFEQLKTIPIMMDDRLIGWLGLQKAGVLLHPLDLEFMARQNRVFLIIGASILLLGVFMALSLSVQFLAPIRRLAQGTRALSARRFDYKIPVKTNDELGRLAEDFNKMAVNLGEYEKRQKQWLSDVSHELRTPLAILIGEIEALQDGIRRPDETALASLHQEASRLGQIVNDLNELSLAESGGLAFKSRPVRLEQLLRETLQRFKSRLEAGQIKTFVHFPHENQATARGDESRLAQVFSNLMENVLRHARKPGTLSISLARSLAPDLVHVIFEDSGPGVPEESLPFLFDRLYRVDSARSRSTGGSGLGLAICRSIVAKHGGKIDAVNSPRGGLRIEIELPADEGE